MQQDKVFITWYDEAIWHIYKMKTTDISMLIIIHMQSKRKSYIVRVVLKMFITIQIKILLLHGSTNVTSTSTPSGPLTSCNSPSCNKIRFFLAWYGGNRWQIYKMKTTDNSMLITIHIQSKRKSYILRNFKYWLSALKGWVHIFWKISQLVMYLMTLCGKSCNKTVYSYKNKDYVIRRDLQNVTSESTPSGPLTS